NSRTRAKPTPRSICRCGRTATALTTISPASRNGPPPAAWGSKNGDRPAPNPRRGPCHAGARIEPRLLGVRLGERRFGQDPRAGATGDPAIAQRRAAGEDSLHHLHQGRGGQYGGAGVF